MEALGEIHNPKKAVELSFSTQDGGCSLVAILMSNRFSSVAPKSLEHAKVTHLSLKCSSKPNITYTYNSPFF